MLRLISSCAATKGFAKEKPGGPKHIYGFV